MQFFDSYCGAILGQAALSRRSERPAHWGRAKSEMNDLTSKERKKPPTVCRWRHLSGHMVGWGQLKDARKLNDTETVALGFSFCSPVCSPVFRVIGSSGNNSQPRPQAGAFSLSERWAHSSVHGSSYLDAAHANRELALPRATPEFATIGQSLSTGPVCSAA